MKIKNYVLNNLIGCCFCGCDLDAQNITVDHIVPRSLGGKSYDGNYIVCCSRCNSYKNDSSLEEYLISDLDRFKYTKKYLKMMEGYYYYDKLHRTTEHYVTVLRSKLKILKCRR